MELLDIRTIDGLCTGQVKERSQVHADGDIHGTSHVWISRKNDHGSFDLLLQKRSATKDAYPGCYDISSAGHLPSGQEYLESALRELEEELGIYAKAEDLHYLGIHEGYFEEVFYGRLFRNHEVSYVYVYEKEVDADSLHLQEEEVESVRWMSVEDVEKKIAAGEKEYQCLIPHEIEMLKEYYKTAMASGVAETVRFLM